MINAYKYLRNSVTVLLCAAMFAYPVGVKANGKMISTTDVVAELTNKEIHANISEFMSREDVRAQMEKMGVSPDEASTRLASMSDSELQQVAKEIEKQKAGSDVLVISLGTILIIVLIVFLIRRI